MAASGSVVLPSSILLLALKPCGGCCCCRLSKFGPPVTTPGAVPMRDSCGGFAFLGLQWPEAGGACNCAVVFQMTAIAVSHSQTKTLLFDLKSAKMTRQI